jgi:hypothetical protein
MPLRVDQLVRVVSLRQWARQTIYAKISQVQVRRGARLSADMLTATISDARQLSRCAQQHKEVVKRRTKNGNAPSPLSSR